MKPKDFTTLSDLFMILNHLESAHIPYWVEGGWGVDILIGKQTRPHRDIDIDFDGEYEEVLLESLQKKGYQITNDLRPTRIELYHPQRGYLDLHPLIIGADGTIRQDSLDGGWYQFDPKWFSSSLFEGRMIPCYSYEAQQLFHTGYPLREVDRIDLENLSVRQKNK